KIQTDLRLRALEAETRVAVQRDHRVDPELQRNPVAPLSGGELEPLASRLDRQAVAAGRQGQRHGKIDRAFAPEGLAGRAGEPGELASRIRFETHQID